MFFGEHPSRQNGGEPLLLRLRHLRRAPRRCFWTSGPLPGEFLRRAFAVVAFPVSFLVLRAFLADFALLRCWPGLPEVGIVLLAPLRAGIPLPSLKEGGRRSFSLTVAELFLARLVRRSGSSPALVEERTVAAGALSFSGLPVLRSLDFYVVPLLMFEDRPSVPRAAAFIVTLTRSGFGGPGLLPLAFEGLLRPVVPAITGSIPFKALRFPVVRPAVSEERQAGSRGFFIA